MIPRNEHHFPKTVFILIGCLYFFSTSCSSKSDAEKGNASGFFSGKLFDADDFTQMLKSSLHAVDTSDSTWKKQKIHSVTNTLAYVYEANHFQPIWLDKRSIGDASTLLLQEIASMEKEGLNPENYHYSILSEQLKKMKGAEKLDLKSVITFDTLCTRSYLQASHDLLLGAVAAHNADSLWYHVNDTIWNASYFLINELTKNDKYVSLDSFRSKLPAYSLLCTEYKRYLELQKDSIFVLAKNKIAKGSADDSIMSSVIYSEIPWSKEYVADSNNKSSVLLRIFQKYYSLRVTGKTDSATNSYLSREPETVACIIKANLERLRWLPRSLEQEFVMVDIPMMELFFNKDGKDTMRMRVVVGKPERQTPALNATMSNVVFNPSWGVPPTILKQDVLPGITKSGAKYLAKKGLRAYDSKGNSISSYSITPHNYRHYTFKQPPGDDNSLGNIKFNLPNQWDIYLHDTPHKEDFPMRYRAKSSGCIRIEKPREFAEFILAELEKKRYTDGRIDSVIKTHKTKYEILAHKIPVHIVYLTAYADSTGNRIRFMNDIYKRDPRLVALLK